MPAKQEQYLFGAPLRLAAAALIEELWLPDQVRLKALLELSTAPQICLLDCLQALFPDKTPKSALGHFRSFRKRVNDVASEHGFSLRCVVDQKKRRPLGERSCWFTTLKPGGIDACASARAGAGASADTLDFVGLLLTGATPNVPPLPVAEGRLLESPLQAAPRTARPAEAGTPTAAYLPLPPGEGRGEGRTPTGPRPHPNPLPQGEGTHPSLKTLNEILASPSLPAAMLAFRYWLHAIAHGLPEPAPRHVNLAGADLEGWIIRGRSPDQPLPLRGANLEGARINRARLENVDLTTANLKHLAAREALFLNVAASHADLSQSNLSDLKWRVGSLAEARLRDARISGTQWIDADLTGASLPENWEHDAAFLDRARMEMRPTVQPRAAELVALPASAARITACGFSPDGRFVVSGANDGTLRIWNADTGACLLMLAGHTSPVKTCGFSPDGRQIVSVSRPGMLKAWDSDSGEYLGTQPRRAEVATESAASPDGRGIASIADDASLKVCDAATGTCLWTGYHFSDGQSAALDLAHNRILSASAEAWRFLGWRWLDPVTGRLRLLPAEFFGPLPR